MEDMGMIVENWGVLVAGGLLAASGVSYIRQRGGVRKLGVSFGLYLFEVIKQLGIACLYIAALPLIIAIYGALNIIGGIFLALFVGIIIVAAAIFVVSITAW